MILQIKLISYQKQILNKYIIKGLIKDLSQFKHRCSCIALPNTIQKYTVLKSPHVNKKSREQFEIRKHSILLTFSQLTLQEKFFLIRFFTRFLRPEIFMKISSKTL